MKSYYIIPKDSFTTPARLITYQRKIRIEYNAKGNAYFRKWNTRYYLDDFLKTSGHFPKYPIKWNGYLTETFFSSVLIKLIDDNEFVKIGLLLS